MNGQDAPAIRTAGLGKRCGSLWALQDCSVSVPRGRVSALVEPNGAGAGARANAGSPAGPTPRARRHPGRSALRQPPAPAGRPWSPTRNAATTTTPMPEKPVRRLRPAVAQLPHRGPSTTIRYETAYRLHVAPVFAHRQVRTIKPSRIQGRIKDLSERFGPSTVITAFLVLHGTLDLAVADEAIKKNPAKSRYPGAWPPGVRCPGLGRPGDPRPDRRAPRQAAGHP
jgi:hypothetical protein